MRVLLVNKFLHHVGGAETVFLDTWRWLEAAGHEVIPFGMAHPANSPSRFAEYQAPHVDYERPSLRALRNLVWSPTAARRLTALLTDHAADIAHLHNIYHQLTPSILPVLKAASIPAVMSVHDYKRVCPNYRLYAGGAPCTRCVQSHPWHALIQACHKESRLASALVAWETAVHRRRNAYATLSSYIVPSRFAGQMLVYGGVRPEQIRRLPHGVPPYESQPRPSSAPERYFLYAGRLVAEKGIDLLLAAARARPELAFVIAGEGPAAPARWPDNCRAVGRLATGALAAWRQHALAVIVPSRWYEIFGMSALEALADGVPVVAANIGALPELVEDRVNGRLFPAGDDAALTQILTELWNDPKEARSLGATGRALAARNHDARRYLAALLEIYHDARSQSAR